MTPRLDDSVRTSVRAALGRHERIVLAVSGGLDSMALLDAAASSLPPERLIVATFDHGTGPWATEARELVEERAASVGLACVSRKAAGRLVSESDLRDARWRFLRSVAAERDAVIATAHTEDDQVETVLMRIMRGAGARGLAGLYARSDVERPLLRRTRRELERYAAERRLGWVEDPSNALRVYFRNRVRHEHLPALRRVRPSIDRELLSIAEVASALRDEVESHVEGIRGLRVGPGGIDVPVRALVDPRAASLLWPAIAARANVTTDRRGIERLAAFSRNGRVGSRVQISGGWEVVRSRDAFQLRQSSMNDGKATPAALALSEETRWGDWCFRAGEGRDDCWSSWLPSDLPLSIRAWQPGDAIRDRANARPRKVKHLLTDAGVTGHQRAGWPVVMSGEEIVWIPGVRRFEAATARSGRPGLAFMCEYIYR